MIQSRLNIIADFLSDGIFQIRGAESREEKSKLVTKLAESVNENQLKITDFFLRSLVRYFLQTLFITQMSHNSRYERVTKQVFNNAIKNFDGIVEFFQAKENYVVLLNLFELLELFARFKANVKELKHVPKINHLASIGIEFALIFTVRERLKKFKKVKKAISKLKTKQEEESKLANIVDDVEEPEIGSYGRLKRTISTIRKDPLEEIDFIKVLNNFTINYSELITDISKVSESNEKHEIWELNELFPWTFGAHQKGQVLRTMVKEMANQQCGNMMYYDRQQYFENLEGR
jgi:hypothetical protein